MKEGLIVRIEEIKLLIARNKLASQNHFNSDSKKAWVDRLIEMSSQGAKNVQEVGINDGQAVEMIAGRTEHLFAPALNGGQVILVLQRSKLGSIIATLTHFDPTRIVSNIHRLKQLIKKYESMADTSSPAKVLLSVPAYIEGDQKRILFEEANKELEASIKNVLQHSKVQKIPYNFNVLGCGKTFIASLGRIQPATINVSIPECQYWQKIEVS